MGRSLSICSLSRSTWAERRSVLIVSGWNQNELLTRFDEQKTWQPVLGRPTVFMKLSSRGSTNGVSIGGFKKILAMCSRHDLRYADAHENRRL